MEEQLTTPPPWIAAQPILEKEPSAPMPSQVQSGEPKGGRIQKSPFRFIVPIIGVVAFVAFAYFLVSNLLPKIKKPEERMEKIALSYWGLWEQEGIVESLIADYQKDHPEIEISYTQQSPKDYRERLQSALARGEGPDIFRFHNTWLVMLKNELSPVPQGDFEASDYFPVITKDLKIGESYYGLPLYFDSLALFYNPRLFSQGGKIPPTTWIELRTTAKDLTVVSQGRIETAGIAMGTTSNVDHFSDILSLLMLQMDVDLTNPVGSRAEEALKFYTNFVTLDRVWDETLPSSTYAFAMEKVAMIFAPSWRAFNIKEINPDLEFKTAPVPQLSAEKVAWATYWIEGVSKSSKNTKTAWDFLKFLSSKETLPKLYEQEKKVRLFGEPYPRISLAKDLEADPIVGAFVSQGPFAKSWYAASRTFDNGINDRIIKYLEDAINTSLQKGDQTKALQSAASGIKQVLSVYGLATSSIKE